MVASPSPGMPIRRFEEGVDFFRSEELDHRFSGPLGRDREDLSDRGSVFGVIRKCATEDGTDRGQASVPGLGIVTANMYEVVEEPSDIRDGEGIEIDPFHGDTLHIGHIFEEHPPGVSVRSNRVTRQVTLGVSESGEVGLQARGQGIHDRSPSEGSSIPAASVISSLVAVRYQ